MNATIVHTSNANISRNTYLPVLLSIPHISTLISSLFLREHPETPFLSQYERKSPQISVQSDFMRTFAEPSVLPPFIGDYQLHGIIGRGGFSSVCKATHIPTAATVAVKVIGKSSVDPEKIATELDLMRKIDHPFIVAFYDFLEDSDNYYIVMEFCPNGTLLDRVNKTSGITEPLIRHVMSQLACALNYLHNDLRVAHRDIKLENIMFDAYDNVRLIDFGLSRAFLGEYAILHTACGSPAYASPEMLSGRVYGTPADIWSLGICLYGMVYGRLPFRSPNIQRLISMILSDEPVYERSPSPGLADLMKGMLCKDWQKRITISKVCSHSWLAGAISVLSIEHGMMSHATIDEEVVAGMAADGNKCDKSALLNGDFPPLYRMRRREKNAKQMAERRGHGNRESTDVQAILQRMRENRREENKSLPPLNCISPPGVRLTKANRFGKSMNPRQAQALHQAVVSIISNHSPHRTRIRRLSEAVAQAPQLTPDYASILCQ